MGKKIGLVDVIMMLVVAAGILCFKASVPRNGPVDGKVVPGQVKLVDRRGEAHWVATVPHWENRGAVIGALAMPGALVCMLLWRFIRGPQKYMGTFVGGVFGMAFIGGIMWWNAYELEHGGWTAVYAFVMPLFEVFGLWGPVYGCFGVAGLCLILAVAAGMFPVREELEDPEIQW